MPLMHIRAVLFDLDGTLAYTLPDIADAMNRALRAAGLPPHPIEAYKHIVGGGIRTCVTRAVPDGTPESVQLAVLDSYRAYYPVHCCDSTIPYDGIAAVLTALNAADIPTGVITNKTEANSHIIVNRLFPDAQLCFNWGNNGTRPLKPAPEAGALACRALDLLPAQIAFVGDSDVDMAFAKAAGFHAIGAVWGYRGAEELQAAGADQLCQTPDALYAYLRSLDLID